MELSWRSGKEKGSWLAGGWGVADGTNRQSHDINGVLLLGTEGQRRGGHGEILMGGISVAFLK